VPSFVLGSGARYGFSPLDVAEAYATIANQGTYCPPVVITKITTATGQNIPVPNGKCHRVVPNGLANTITSIMHGDLTVPGATATSDNLSDRPAAAKTGTVDEYRGSWFAGFTPQMAAAVWTGVPSSSQRSLEGLTFGGHTYDYAVFGATVSGRIWQATLNAALAGVPVVPLPAADQFYDHGVTTPIPDVDGESVSSAESDLIAAGFSPTVASGAINSTEPLGTVASTSPGGGSSGSTGETVTIYVSNGVAPKPTHSPKPGKSPPAHPTGKPTNSPAPPVSPPVTPPPTPTSPTHPTHPTHSPSHARRH
jgi:membrane peptidoglycan carboxypeptidase